MGVAPGQHRGLATPGRVRAQRRLSKVERSRRPRGPGGARPRRYGHARTGAQGRTPKLWLPASLRGLVAPLASRPRSGRPVLLKRYVRPALGRQQVGPPTRGLSPRTIRYTCRALVGTPAGRRVAGDCAQPGSRCEAAADEARGDARAHPRAGRSLPQGGRRLAPRAPLRVRARDQDASLGVPGAPVAGGGPEGRNCHRAAGARREGLCRTENAAVAADDRPPGELRRKAAWALPGLAPQGSRCPRVSQTNAASRSTSIRLYDLRHSCAMLLLLAGVSTRVVSERLGHASSVLTMDTYQHVQATMQHEATAKLDMMPVQPKRARSVSDEPRRHH